MVDVPNYSPKGHLNIRLRWATPGKLRRLSLLGSGFEIFRLTKASAIAEGWSVALAASTASCVSDAGVQV